MAPTSDQCGGIILLREGDAEDFVACCVLPPGHDGRHQVQWEDGAQECTVTWLQDERFICPRHGAVDNPTGCLKCEEAPVRCELHGLQTKVYCETCCSEPFVCPEHGVASLPGHTEPVTWCPVCKLGPDKHWVRQYPDPSDC